MEVAQHSVVKDSCRCDMNFLLKRNLDQFHKLLGFYIIEAKKKFLHKICIFSSQGKILYIACNIFYLKLVQKPSTENKMLPL